MRKTKPFTQEMAVKEKEIIVYGASTYGEIAYHGLRLWDRTPDFYCDRASQGKFKGGVPIIDPEEIHDHPEAAIIIASADYFSEIIQYLDYIGVSTYYDMEDILKLPIDKSQLSGRAVGMMARLDLYNEAVSNIPDENTLNLVHLSFGVSEKCTLKCRDCSFLMPYYKQPQHIDLDNEKPYIDRILKVVDRISDFRPIGGEPFVSPEMYKLIEWYHESPKIGNFYIYTNGTIIPEGKNLEVLTYPNVCVRISNYGLPQEKVDRLVELFEKNGIRYAVCEYTNWQRGGNLQARGYSTTQMKKVFSRCYMAKCFAYLKGRIYGCPRAAHGTNLGIIPDDAYNYVDITDMSISDDELKRRLIELTQEREYLLSCNYCNGFDTHIDGVKPAIQC